VKFGGQKNMKITGLFLRLLFVKATKKVGFCILVNQLVEAAQ
jgi:hypothetical protein